jgi:hypothetical protein
MNWHRCSCGLIVELTSRFGDAIVSVIDLHRAARVDGSSAPRRMEEIPDPVPARGIPCDPTTLMAAVAIRREAALTAS